MPVAFPDGLEIWVDRCIIAVESDWITKLSPCEAVGGGIGYWNGLGVA